MAMGKKRERQQDLWIAMHEPPRSRGHIFYDWVNFEMRLPRAPFVSLWFFCGYLRHSDFPGQINILNRIQQCNAFLHRPLEGFSSGDQPHTAGSLVDDSCPNGFLQVAFAG
jgi:hypothetical protein